MCRHSWLESISADVSAPALLSVTRPHHTTMLNSTFAYHRTHRNVGWQACDATSTETTTMNNTPR
jgi:hypothetical protein